MYRLRARERWKYVSEIALTIEPGLSMTMNCPSLSWWIIQTGVDVTGGSCRCTTFLKGFTCVSYLSSDRIKIIYPSFCNFCQANCRSLDTDAWRVARKAMGQRRNHSKRSAIKEGKSNALNTITIANYCIRLRYFAIDSCHTRFKGILLIFADSYSQRKSD